MPTLKNIVSGRMVEPVRLFVYGGNGLGKTTFIAESKSPILFDIEGGSGHLNIPRFTKEDLSSYPLVIQGLNTLLDEEHQYKFLGIDTLDWLEQLIWEHTCKEGSKTNIEDFGYGKGYSLATKYWLEFLSLLERLRSEKQMNVILTAHSLVKAYTAPDENPYDRYQPDLHKNSFSLIRDWCDCLFFANYKTYTKEVKAGMKVTVQGIGDGERVMFTQERPAFYAKNRYDLPLELPFSFASFAEHYGAWLKTNGTTTTANS